MTQPIQFKGSCHCRAVTYEVEGDNPYSFICHCVDCCKLQGGGRLAGIAFDQQRFKVSGATTMYSYPGGSGKPIEAHFCKVCGTGIFGMPTYKPGLVIVRANTLDDPSQYLPRKVIYADDAFHWDQPLSFK